MARRKSDSSAGRGLGVLAMLLLICIAIAATYFPLVMLLLWAWKSFQARGSTDMLTGTLEDYWLDHVDRIEFKELSLQKEQQEEFLQQEEARAEHYALRRNQNGAISARSHLGKEIRGNLDAAREAIRQLEARLETLRFIPFYKWSEVNDQLRTQRSYGVGFLAWLCAVGAVCGYVGSLAPISNVWLHSLQDPVLLIENFGLNPWMLLIAGTSAIGLLALLLYRSTAQPLAAYTPEPDLVDEDNVMFPAARMEPVLSPGYRWLKSLVAVALAVAAGWGTAHYSPPRAEWLTALQMQPVKEAPPKAELVEEPAVVPPASAPPVTAPSVASPEPAVIPKAEVVKDEPTMTPPTAELYRIAGLAPGDTLNLRAAPSAESPILTSLPQGTEVRLTGRNQPNATTLWLEVQSGPFTGWLNSTFLTK